MVLLLLVKLKLESLFCCQAAVDEEEGDEEKVGIAPVRRKTSDEERSCTPPVGCKTEGEEKVRTPEGCKTKDEERSVTPPVRCKTVLAILSLLSLLRQCCSGCGRRISPALLKRCVGSFSQMLTGTSLLPMPAEDEGDRASKLECERGRPPSRPSESRSLHFSAEGRMPQRAPSPNTTASPAASPGKRLSREACDLITTPRSAG